MRPTAREALCFTLINMPNLRHIICLGKFSYDFCSDYFGVVNLPWREALTEHKKLAAQDGRLAIYASSHTGKLGIKNRMKGGTMNEKEDQIRRDWQHIFAHIKSV